MTEPINRFLALSFPGEHRKFVEDVADFLSRELGEGRVLYDRFHEAELSGQTWILICRLFIMTNPALWLCSSGLVLNGARYAI